MKGVFSDPAGSLGRHRGDVVAHLLGVSEKACREGHVELANAYTSVAVALAPLDLDVHMRRVLYLEKLALYAEAYDAARAMIDLAPHDARGYLRAGRVLLVQGKASEAHHWFQSALRVVPATDPRHALLEIYRQRSRPQTPSFVSRCPYEVTRHIFRLLPLADLVPCTRVCKHWRQFILHCPDLWRSIDLRDYPAQKRIPRNALAQCVQRAIDPAATLPTHAAHGLRELWVGNRMSIHDVVDVLVAKQSLNLSVLYLSDSDLTGRIWARMMLKQLCMNLEHLFLSMTDISIVDVMVSGASLPNLTQLVLDGCAFGYAFSKNIASHDLSGGAQVVPSQYNNSQPSAMGVVPFPKLQVLGLSSVNDMSIYALVWLLVRCPSLSMLRTLNARLKLTLVLLAVGQYCPQIKYLEYSAMSHYTPMPIDDTQLTLLPHALQSLRCRAKQDDAVLHSLLARCAPSLQYLSTVVADTTLYFMSARPWPQLNVLEIPLSVDVSEMALTASIKAFTHLTHIDVSYNQTAVTDAFLVTLGASCPSIQVLRVAGCTQLSDAAMAECTLQLDQLHTLGLFGLDLTRKTITHIVLDGGLRAGGIIECPHDIIVQRTPTSYPPSMPPHLTHHFETLIDAIFYAMRADPYASNATADDNLMSSSAKPPTPLPTSLAPSSPPDMDNDEIPLTNALRDILRKDDLWSVYI